VDGLTISFRGVRFAYRTGAVVLDLPALDIGPGLTLLLGSNGAGKTTLMRIASGVERPDAGTVAIGGHDLWTDEVAARRVLAYIPEHPDLTPYATVGEIAALVARLRGEPDESARQALAAAGLDQLGRRTVRELSLGQRRRAVVAAAMIGAPSVLLLDEPLEALDADMRARFLGWVESALDRGATALVATHETAPWTERCGRSIRLIPSRTT